MNRLALLLPISLLVFIACGSDDADPPFPQPTPVNTGPSRPSRPGSSSSSSSGGDNFGCPLNELVTPSDLDKELGWKSTSAAPGSCTAEDLDKLEANFKDATVQSYFDLGNGLSETCKACATSRDTDPTWGPIVGVVDTAGAAGFVNYGACFGAIEGAACGKAVQYEIFCTKIACGQCAGTSGEMQECLKAALTDGGMCNSFLTQKQTDCPSYALNVKSCGNLLLAVKTLCGTPP